MIIEINKHKFVAAEYRRLANGKFKGVVVESLIGRFSVDEFQILCAEDRETEEEALADARALVSAHTQ